MKLITLNTWGGRVHKPLISFLSVNKDIDIFCFQEMYHHAPKPLVEDLGDRLKLLEEIQEVLPDHISYFKPHFSDYYGLAIFVKKNIPVKEEGDIFVYEIKNTEQMGNCSRNLQYIKLKNDDEDITITNIHGLWNGKGKTDTEDRLLQSKKIKEFMNSIDGKKILCGDFNLLPDTESVKILEDGMMNLIKEYNIESTRTSLYKKPEKHADYIFVSPDLKVSDFKVLPDEVSDHSPLYLEF